MDLGMQWIAMAVLTAAASLALLFPLLRRGTAAAEGNSASPIYREQLESLAGEAARGVIAPSEAEAARTEIARRLIRAEGERAAVPPGPSRRRAAVIAVAALVLLPAAAFAMYQRLGVPNFPDMPLAARISGPVDQHDIGALIYRMEAQLAAHPDNKEGWGLIVRVYDSLGMTGKAVNAYRNLVRLEPVNAGYQAGLGMAMVRAADGDVSSEALGVFATAIKLDPKPLGPRLYHALGLGQAGRNAEAIEEFRAVIRDAPADAPWLGEARAELARLEGPPARGPTGADVAAAGQMSSTDRNAMISGMVAQLADRLAREPDDPNGWAQLIRSYSVLGRTDDARSALATARRTFAASPERLAALDTLAKSLNLAD
jgi:cytochrome c-type biogenesis protein CcmH